jgi:Rrf2 family iron-sulfur cluster assembly transcriptional regulator
MVFSRSAEYAIRALTVLAGAPPDQPMLVKRIAADAQIPEPFLSKLLQDLVRDGFLRSNKGPHGGFRFASPPSEIRLLKIVEAVDGAGRYNRCIEGNPECNDRVFCAIHDSWIPVRRRIVEWLESTSFADLAKSFDDKRRVIARSRPLLTGKRSPRK